MKAKYIIIFLLCVFGVTFGYSNAQDSLNNSRNLTADEILLRYTEILKQDAKGHRDYVESYYDRILYTLGGLGSIMSVVFGFFGWRTYKKAIGDAEIAAKKQLNELFEMSMKDELEKFWKEKGIENRFQDLIEKNRQNTNINIKQESMISNLNKIVTSLKMAVNGNYKIERSLTQLEYVKSDGSDVLYLKEEGMKCVLDKVDETTETIYLGEGATIEMVELDPSYEVINQNGKCEIKIKFDPPLNHESPVFQKRIKCRLNNSFMEESEWWEIFQLYKCNEAVFKLILHESRDCRKIWVELLDLDNKIQPIESDIKKEQLSNNRVSYAVQLPPSELAVRYRVHWEFL